MIPDNHTDQTPASITAHENTGAIDVCGLVVLSQPERQASVRDRLRHIPGLVVHADNDRGTMAVTLENCCDTTIPTQIDAMRTIPGVMDIALAYSHRE